VLVGVDPKTVRRPDTKDNPEIRARMREIAEQRRRFGYRRIGVLLEREGLVSTAPENPATRWTKIGPRGARKVCHARVMNGTGKAPAGAFPVPRTFEIRC
jgi:hypothetical protein